MLNALFHRAQATVDNAIGQAVNKAVVALPFVVALGFATAALTERMTREFGTEQGYLAVAGVFALLGLIMSLAALRPRKATPQSVAGDAPDPATAAPDAGEPRTPMSPADRELITAALTTTAPIALPALFSALVRNLPLVAAIAAVLYVLTRPASSTNAYQSQDFASPEPAEGRGN